MELEKIPTVPTADEIMDRSLRRAAKRMKEKTNKDRANEEFVRSVKSAVHDRLVAIIQKFPVFDELSPFYREMVEALFGIDRVKQSLGAVAWAAWNTHLVGSGEARLVRHAEETRIVRKRAVARISSIVHQIDKDLLFLNEVRNRLRQLPEISDEFTVVIAGYPNVGKSSFIRQVSGAEPEIAPYPFTTKGIIVGHRSTGRRRVQFVDTPGLLDRPMEERNRIERQALGALLHVADVVLFILDPSETCGYPLEQQLHLLAELRMLVKAPIIVVQNKADLATVPDYPAMSTVNGSGVGEILEVLLREQGSRPTRRPAHIQPEIQE
ncbi:MAG: 50S ribosome-binding GTPase [Methanomicrobiales archaeon]|nr:50S ribosome-binding GTPase [Methanomicrobiales archaeon]